MYLVPKKIQESERVRNSIGGYPFVPDGYGWPICPYTNKKMVLFLQLDLPNEMGFGDDRHLSIFMSPEINEIPSFNFIPPGENLSEEFWAKREKHFKAYIFNGKGTTFEEPDQYLEYQYVSVVESGSDNDIKLGGIPDWLQDPEVPIGPKGEEFKLVLQVPENYGFPRKSDAKEQPDSFSSKEYCLFLGNQIYVFASIEIEHSEAVWIVVQG